MLNRYPDERESLLSIIIPAKNAEETIARTIDSLSSARSYIGELIIINDGSTDNTVKVAIASGQALNVDVQVHEGGSRGVSAARNIGLSYAKFPLIYFIDADDICIASGLIELILTLSRDRRKDLAVGSAIDNNGTSTSIHKAGTFGIDAIKNAEAYITYSIPLIRIGSVVVRRELLYNQRFPEGLAYQEDGIFWAKVLAKATPIAVQHNTVECFSNRARSNLRLTMNHRAKFITLMRAMLKLRYDGLSQAALYQSIGANALTLSRKLSENGNYVVALGYLRLAWHLSNNLGYRTAIIKGTARILRDAGTQLVLGRHAVIE